MPKQRPKLENYYLKVGKLNYFIMKNLFKLGLVVLGFALATIATTENVQAKSQKNVAPSGGCVGSGKCGITSQGTLLIGKWRE